jgi:hypothetical protein
MAATRIRFFNNNLWPSAAVTASSAVASLPATATQNTQRTGVWRSNAEAAPTLNADLGSSKAVTGGALVNVRIVSGTLSTIKLQWSNDGATGWTDFATLSTIDTESLVGYGFAASATKRYWRFLFTPTSGTIQVEVGIAVVGTYLETSVNVTAPNPLQLNDPSVVSRAIDGQRSTSLRTLFMSSTWDFRDLPEADALALRLMYRSFGQGTPHVVVLDTTRSWMAWCAFFTETYGNEAADRPGRYNLRIGWEEAR